MFTVGRYLQIFNGIIEHIAINMMNMLMAPQRSSNVLLNYYPMQIPTIGKSKVAPVMPTPEPILIIVMIFTNVILNVAIAGAKFSYGVILRRLKPAIWHLAPIENFTTRRAFFIRKDY